MPLHVLLSLFLISALTACQGHVPLTIAPMSPTERSEIMTSSETSPQISTPTTKAPALPSGTTVHAASSYVVSRSTTACPPAHWRKVPNHAFGERETWVFEVSWGVIKAGEAVLKVEGIEPIRGRPAYHLSMEILATGMTGKIHPYRDLTDSWLDQESLSTVLFRHAVRENTYQADETWVLDPSCQRFKKVTKRLDKNETESREGQVSPGVLDMDSALFYLRAQPLTAGQVYDLKLWAGSKAVAVTAHISSKESIKVGAGTFDCFRIEMHTDDASAAKRIQQVQWWLSADEKHIPVRIRMDVGIGHINADLKRL